MTATLAPNLAAKREARTPPLPPPIVMRSKSKSPVADPAPFSGRSEEARMEKVRGLGRGEAKREGRRGHGVNVERRLGRKKVEEEQQEEEEDRKTEA